MHLSGRSRRVLGVLALAAGGYAAYAALAWIRYGRPRPPGPGEADPLLDRFMPVYDTVERHHARVRAPAARALAAACDHDFEASPIVRALFRTRAFVMGDAPDTRTRPRGLLAATRALGWGLLAEVPGREIVMGAYTRPWDRNVTFHALPPEAFAAFDEPGWVRIAWTLRADPVDAGTSVFRTETRAAATSPDARARFRRYWALASPGIALIRRVVVTSLRRSLARP